MSRPNLQTRDRQRTETEPAERTDRRSCPDCGAEGSVVEDGGETVCRNCDAVVEEDVVDRGPEWRSFSHDEKRQKSRVGAPTTDMLHDRGLSSVIDWRDQDAGGRSLSTRKRQQMQRLRTWDERFRSQDAQDRNLKQALGEIDRMASALGLPETVRETASVIYRRALEAELLPGRSIEGMATGALYAAARQAGVPRTLDEFETVSRVEQKEFARAYRYVARELGLAVEPADPLEYLPRLASQLGLEEAVRQRAAELLADGKAAGVHSGKSPVGLAAASIYAASVLDGRKITQGEIAAVADVSEVTIRNRYRELLKAAGEW
ncbi:transcription initiation factor IIB [Haloarculaceae archaeon H-GB1-1]|nr:transcription initiation factor IIB [Haloarculaceae archaeon H-GB1-1]